MTTRTKTPKRKPYVNPVQKVIDAARQAEALRQEIYCPSLCQRLAEHNEQTLIPALEAALEWARRIVIEQEAQVAACSLMIRVSLN